MLVGTTLPAGSYGFTAIAAANGKDSAESKPLRVAVELAGPAVTLTAPASTVDPNPQLIVTATDLVGLPTTTTVTLDVDLNDNGSFSNPGETGYQTATMTNGVAVFNLSPALSPGTYPMRARVDNLAGNQGTSAVTTMVLSATGSAWTITDTTPQIDPVSGDAQLQRGNLAVSQPLDLTQSPDSGAGILPANADLALVYNSERVSIEPIVQATIQSDNSTALPSTIKAQLTINGTAQSAVTYNTTGLSPGDLLTVAQQVFSPLTATGRDTYTLTVTMNYATPIVRSISGAFYVVSEAASPFGAGWTFGGTDQLVSIAASGSYPAGLLRVYGAGGAAFYAQSGTSYTSPVGDAGTLSAVTGGYQYVSPEGETWNFNSSGQETSLVSPDGQSIITFTYSSGNLTGIATPDGALTTIAYSSGLAQTIQTGSRTVTLSYNSGMGSSTLAKLTNPDGGLRTFSYDGFSHLTQDQFGVLSTTYAYTDGQETSYTPGDGGAFTLSPADLVGLSALAVTPYFASSTDPLGRVTRGPEKAGKDCHAGIGAASEYGVSTGRWAGGN